MKPALAELLPRRPLPARSRFAQRRQATERNYHRGTETRRNANHLLRAFVSPWFPLLRFFVPSCLCGGAVRGCEVPLATEAPRRREKLPQRHRDTEERESSSPCLCVSVVPTNPAEGRLLPEFAVAIVLLGP